VRAQHSSSDRPRRGTLDIARARRLLGYRPGVELETGVQRYVAFLRAQVAAAPAAAAEAAL
jgi:nucleoside-diphosphate-sugar epimerase